VHPKLKSSRTMTPSPPSLHRQGVNRRGYTLIEALVASSILMIGIAAASSMSLSFITQEEISERAAKAYNHLDNAVALYETGLSPAEIAELLPHADPVTSVTFANLTLAATNLGNVPAAQVTVTWNSTGATSSSGTARWTGGTPGTTRSASVEIVRSNRTLESPLPRVDFFK
jgi:type II secretory pathway component PulJ